jgi:hypothetical protein
MAAKRKRRKIKVAPYDSADYLKTEADIKNYLDAVFEEPMDRQMLIHTLGVVARARKRPDVALGKSHPAPTSGGGSSSWRSERSTTLRAYREVRR